MRCVLEIIPDDPREQQLTAQLEQCKQALAVTQRENLLLRQKTDALARRIFGVSSEALDPAQLQLPLQMPELKPVETAPVLVEKPKPMVAVRKHRAPRLPDNLPVIEKVIDPEPVKEQPENWRLIGHQKLRPLVLYDIRDRRSGGQRRHGFFGPRHLLKLKIRAVQES